ATVPVTTLEAIAAAVGAGESGSRAPLLVVLDAKRSDLYGQWFDAGGLPLTPPLAAPVEALWRSRPAGAAAVRLAGDATDRVLPEPAAGTPRVTVAGDLGPDARAVALVAE